MNGKIALLLSIFSIVFMIAGCAGQRWQTDYGTSYNLAKFNQTLNPDAEQNLEPVIGFNGAAAYATVDRYQKSFEKAAPPPTYSVNVTGIRTGVATQY